MNGELQRTTGMIGDQAKGGIQAELRKFRRTVDPPCIVKGRLRRGRGRASNVQTVEGKIDSRVA